MIALTSSHIKSQRTLHRRLYSRTSAFLSPTPWVYSPQFCVLTWVEKYGKTDIYFLEHCKSRVITYVVTPRGEQAVKMQAIISTEKELLALLTFHRPEVNLNRKQWLIHPSCLYTKEAQQYVPAGDFQL